MKNIIVPIAVALILSACGKKEESKVVDVIQHQTDPYLACIERYVNMFERNELPTAKFESIDHLKDHCRIMAKIREDETKMIREAKELLN